MRTAVTLENARSTKATELKARQTETDKLARKVADEAQASGVTSGSGVASIARTGERFTSLPGESKLHPIVQRIYDQVPQRLRQVFHSKCCEGNNTSQMLNAGVNSQGPASSVVRIRKPGHPDHGIPVPANYLASATEPHLRTFVRCCQTFAQIPLDELDSSLVRVFVISLSRSLVGLPRCLSLRHFLLESLRFL
jgi:hypothetical protein